MPIHPEPWRIPPPERGGFLRALVRLWWQALVMEHQIEHHLRMHFGPHSEAVIITVPLVARPTRTTQERRTQRCTDCYGRGVVRVLIQGKRRPWEPATEPVVCGCCEGGHGDPAKRRGAEGLNLRRGTR